MEAVLADYLPGLKRQQMFSFAGSFIVLLTGDKGTLVTLRGFPQGLVTCNIEYYREDEEKPLLLFEVIRVAVCLWNCLSFLFLFLFSAAQWTVMKFLGVV
jgi:hypothetical protein